MSHADYAELTTVDEFEAAVAARDRIVITDIAGDPKVHTPDCLSVTTENFTQKVVTNQGASGQYFRARNTTIAEAQGAVRCGQCYG